MEIPFLYQFYTCFVSQYIWHLMWCFHIIYALFIYSVVYPPSPEYSQYNLGSVSQNKFPYESIVIPYSIEKVYFKYWNT